MAISISQGPPPELVPIDASKSSDGEPTPGSRETPPARKAALRSAETTKIMSQVSHGLEITENMIGN